MTMKKCTVCDELLPLDDFYRDRCSNDGHESRCKQCKLASKVRTTPRIDNPMFAPYFCRQCWQLKPAVDFSLNRANKNTGRRHECRECQHDRVRTRKERAARGYSLAMEDRIPPSFTLRKEDDSPMPWVLRDAGEELGRFPVWPKKPCDLCIVMGGYIMDDIQDKPILMKHFFYAQDPRVAQTRARRQRAAA